MTNIMAVTVGDGKGGRAVYVCTDSQATIGEQKLSSQKLFYRGGNFIAWTGSQPRAFRTIDDIDKMGKSVEPRYVCERIVDFSKETFAWGKENSQGYIVAGVESGEPVIYSVLINERTLDSQHSDWETIEKRYHTFQGSGSRHTAPAIQRDMETGNILLPDLAEGMWFCFSLSQRADVDLFVNDNLQIGLVTPRYTRVLYHPAVYLGEVSKGDRVTDHHLNFGIDLTDTNDLSEDDRAGLDDMGATMNDLYHYLLVESMRLTRLDRWVNSAHTAHKTTADVKEREKCEAEKVQGLQKRDTQKTRLVELVDSWASGDFSMLRESLKKYHERREEMHESGARALEKLRSKKLGSQKPANGSAELGGEKAPF